MMNERQEYVVKCSMYTPSKFENGHLHRVFLYCLRFALRDDLTGMASDACCVASRLRQQW